MTKFDTLLDKKLEDFHNNHCDFMGGISSNMIPLYKEFVKSLIAEAISKPLEEKTEECKHDPGYWYKGQYFCHKCEPTPAKEIITTMCSGCGRSGRGNMPHAGWCAKKPTQEDVLHCLETHLDCDSYCGGKPTPEPDEPRQLKFDINRRLIEKKQCPNCHYWFEKHEMVEPIDADKVAVHERKFHTNHIDLDTKVPEKLKPFPEDKVIDFTSVHPAVVFALEKLRLKQDEIISYLKEKEDENT